MHSLLCPFKAPRIALAAALVLAFGLPASSTFGKLKEVPIVLMPVSSPSALPEQYRALPSGRKLPDNWHYFPRPPYPRELERLGVEGEATVEFVVNAHGYVVFAHILEATDQRFGESVLSVLGWLRPMRDTPADAMLPARFLLPIGFSIGSKSDIRDPRLVAKITTGAPLATRLSFQKPFDLNPRYPGLAAARTTIKKDMSSMEVVDTIGEPVVRISHVNGDTEFGFGPDLYYPELMVLFSKDRVKRVSEGEKAPAAKTKR